MIGDETRGRRRRPRKRIEPYRLGELTKAYFIALIIWFGAAGISVELNTLLLFIIAHFVLGFFLSRFASARVVFNWHTSNLSDVAKAKWTMFVGWPIYMPIFLVQLAIYKHL